MCEILFRGKRMDNGEWVYGDLLHDWSRGNTKSDIVICNNMGRFRVDQKTVGQYTGLIDKNGKNGKKIFEGDIVNGFNDLHQRLETYKVKWACNNGFYFVDTCETEWHPEHIEDAEVIGNIHDKPAFLRQV